MFIAKIHPKINQNHLTFWKNVEKHPGNCRCWVSRRWLGRHCPGGWQKKTEIAGEKMGGNLSIYPSIYPSIYVIND